jgi:hypothetical protein
LPAAHQAKDHGEEALDGRALRVYHVAWWNNYRVNFVECAGGKIIIIELPDKEPDGSISNNLYVGGVDSIDQGKGFASEGRL